jgi:NAD+ synthase (glutamine-hydrolysing)
MALAQINPVVGDLEGNSRLIRAAVDESAAAGARLVLLPEMALTGYPIEDLALRPSFQDAARAALDRLAQDLAAHVGITVVVGCLDVLDAGDARQVGRPRRAPVNAAAVIRDGRILARYVKHHLPNYGVFDEARYFVPGHEPLLVDVDGVRVMVAICEDLWQDGGPVSWARDTGCDLLAVLNASPYERDKDDARLALCQTRAVEAGCALAYVNIVGGQDELVFDGDSLVVRADGTLVARAAQFEPALLVVELPGEEETATGGPIAERLDSTAEVHAALVLGLRDYVDKNGFPSVLIGLSGGIDSALVASLAVDAFGPERVFGIAMPSRYSSGHSVADAFDLAARTGLSIREVPIAPMFDAYQSSLDLSGLAEENLQARIRGTTLMGVSNAEGHLVLATGNKSEISVGYSTIYGDAVGGFAPIKDVPKTLVWELSRWRNAEAARRGQTPPIPENSIEKPPSAELRPGQVDADSLPDYEVLDRLLDAYVTGDRSARELVDDGFDRALVERVLRLTDLAEYKRRQYPPGTKITLRAFGRDRRLPITSRWRESG